MSRDELLSNLSDTIESITITLPSESLIYRARLKPEYLIPNDIKSFPEAENYPYPYICSEDIPTEFTEWLLVEYNEGLINDIGYNSLKDPKKINFNENPIPFSKREDSDKELPF